MIKSKQKFKFQTQNWLMISAIILLFVVSLGTLNYVENNNYIINKALAADETPVNPGGGGLDIPKSTSSTGSSTSSTSTTGSSATGSNTTSSTGTSATSTSSTSTTSTTGSASSSASGTSSTSSTGSTTGAESPGDGKTPGALPNGESDVLVIGKDKTITSQTSSPQSNTSVQNTTSQIIPNSVTNNTVRSGGLEVTLASLAVVVLAGYVYYYKKHVHTKGGLKTAEKKISSK